MTFAGCIRKRSIIHRHFVDTVNGEILLNGRPINQEQMSNISGFVCQKDPTFENLTVEEHLSFAVEIFN